MAVGVALQVPYHFDKCLLRRVLGALPVGRVPQTIAQDIGVIHAYQLVQRRCVSGFASFD